MKTRVPVCWSFGLWLDQLRFLSWVGPFARQELRQGNSRVSVGFVQDEDLTGLATEGIFLIYPGLTIIHFIGGQYLESTRRLLPLA